LWAKSRSKDPSKGGVPSGNIPRLGGESDRRKNKEVDISKPPATTCQGRKTFGTRFEKKMNRWKKDMRGGKNRRKIKISPIKRWV